ncbi:proline-rich protein 15 [Engraulis encrasicolus]|uniref:proline-rich protein 15 n=1 Tax=Engraulis encrasicolus TaxID=184585 RepID=UPI002FD45495
MADKAPWWRSFVGKRRVAARESAKEALAQQQQQQQAQASHPHPSTDTKPADSQAHVIHSTGASTDPDRQLTANKRSNSAEDLEQPTFNEATNRRNLRVSRSGRFKEKKKVRVSLTPGAEQELHGGKASAKDDAGA